MTQAQLGKFVVYLQKTDWSVFGPVFTTEKIEELSPFLAAHQPTAVKKTGQILIKEISDSEDLHLDEQVPFYPFKRFFVPEKETIFEYQNNKLTVKKRAPKIALVGMNILDMKAVNLYDEVFAKDPYYRARRKNTLIIGYSATPDSGHNFFEYKYSEDDLKHLPFDIFLTDYRLPTTDYSQTAHRLKAIGYKLFTGSVKGQRILEHFGYENYTHIQFAGPIDAKKPNEHMERLRDRLKNHHNPKIWEELGKICIECGKCTLICPTCFCFRIDDIPLAKENAGERTRCWDSCYYSEFSEVSGGHKFLNTTAQRIHFWYYHKFARIPDEFGFMGCVGCHRCAIVCPVGIDISKVLKEIEES